MAKKKPLPNKLVKRSSPPPTSLRDDSPQLIEVVARGQAAQAVNFKPFVMRWHIGDRIREKALRIQRMKCGVAILSTLSKELKKDYRNGFSIANLSRISRFAGVFRYSRILHLSWGISS